MKIISYSLFGTSEKYLVGAQRNVIINKRIMPDWESYFFVGDDVPASVVEILTSLGATVIPKQSTWHKNGTFWRFYAASMSNAERVAFRDVDSVITEREKISINEWVLSGKNFHIMRDHPHHNVDILAGMWGGVNPSLREVLSIEAMREFVDDKESDQNYLSKYVYPQIKEHSFVNDSFFSRERKRNLFSCPRQDYSFVGESLDEFGKYDENSRKLIAYVESNILVKCSIFIQDKLRESALNKIFRKLRSL